jgi:hypothetical protein
MVMGRFLFSFARANELFLVDTPVTQTALDTPLCCGKQ